MSAALVTDLYELNMAASYLRRGMVGPATFSLFGGSSIAARGGDAGDAPALFFHGTADPLVPYQWAVNTVNNAHAAHLDAFLETWPGAGHVPYVQNRDQILTQTRNFLWWEMDLAQAAH